MLCLCRQSKHQHTYTHWYSAVIESIKKLEEKTKERKEDKTKK